MSQDTADFSPEVHTHQVNSPDNQEFVKDFESFKEYMREGEIADDDLTPEDFKMLSHLQRILKKEAIMEQDYRQDFDKSRNDLERIMNSKIPVQMKLKMSESIGENLKSKMACLREMNKVTKDLIMKVEKTNNYSTYINMIHRWKEASKFGKASSVASTNMSSYAVNSGYNQTLNGENSRKHTQSFLSNQSVGEELTEEQKTLEDLRSENIKLEDMIANLKQSKNFLMMGLENMQDDIEEYEEFVQGKKVVLQETLKRIENLKSQISTTSSKKSTKSHTTGPSKPSRGDHERTDMSRVNTTVLQDVSTKVTGFFGKMFGKKDKVVVSDKMLPSELFHTEPNVYIHTTQGNYTPARSSLTPKSSINYGYKSPTSTKTTKK